MILSFKQKFPDGTPTYFIEKIWRGFFLHKIANGYASADYDFMYREKFGEHWDGSVLLDIPYMSLCRKLHTIRARARWKPGDKIHFCINARTPNYFQFAPVVEVVSVQKITIQWYEKILETNEIDYCKKASSGNNTFPVIWIDDEVFAYGTTGEKWRDNLNLLAKNDGFPSVEAFFEWFDEDFTGQIIHWTSLKY